MHKYGNNALRDTAIDYAPKSNTLFTARAIKQKQLMMNCNENNAQKHLEEEYKAKLDTYNARKKPWSGASDSVETCKRIKKLIKKRLNLKYR